MARGDVDSAERPSSKSFSPMQELEADHPSISIDEPVSGLGAPQANKAAIRVITGPSSIPEHKTLNPKPLDSGRLPILTVA